MIREIFYVFCIIILASNSTEWNNIYNLYELDPKSPIGNCQTNINDNRNCIFQNVKSSEIYLNQSLLKKYFINNRMKYEIIINGENGNKFNVLTNHICEVFKKVLYYDASNIGLELIEVDAFTRCKDLEIIVLNGNRLTDLNADIFLSNEKLTAIDLGINRLKAIQVKWFINKDNLNSILLDQNMLQKFPIEKFPIFKALKNIYLDENKILQLNETLIVEKFPKLKKISFEFNLLSCSSQKQLTNFFNMKRIKILTYDSNQATYKYNLIEGYSFGWVIPSGCIADENWKTLKQDLLGRSNDTIFDNNKIKTTNKTFWIVIWIFSGISLLISLVAFGWSLNCTKN